MVPIYVWTPRGLEFFLLCRKFQQRISIINFDLPLPNRFTSPDGRCYAFDPRASGYGRGEGVAAVILKPLSAALANGDSIRAVIRGTGVSSDGKTNGITLPSEWGQKQALQMAYEDAGLRPQDTYFVEAHGAYTATASIAQSTNYIGQGREQRLVIERKPLFGWTPSCAAEPKISPSLSAP